MAGLDGTQVGGGIAAEIGFAFARGKRIVSYRGDHRCTGDNESAVVGLRVGYFIRARGGDIVAKSSRFPV